MTTTTLPASTGIVETFRRLRLGPYLFIVAVALVDFALIGSDQFVNALTVGAIYALVALGYTMVYGIIELINFAHGDVFMVGAFASMFVLTSILGQDPNAPRRPSPQAVFLIVTTFAIVMP
jgi:branched-subunit amino acid ABC-type transport system permease component